MAEAHAASFPPDKMDAEREIPGDNQPEDVLGYDDLVLIERYGLDGAGLAEVTGLVRDKITPASHRRNSRTAKTKSKVAITLRYLVTGNFDLVADIDPGATSHQTISKVITETLEALVTPEFITRYIKFLTHPGAFHLKVHEFMMLSGFPDAVGVIDCTHVKISRPKQPDDIHYLNPQGFYSINTQLVFDASCRILNVAADWPGSMEDVTVLSKSGLQQLFEKETKSGSCHLVGDSDYETLVWLMTPVFEPPRKRKEKKYNRAHMQAWLIAEQGILQLKHKWKVLDGEVKLNPDKASKVIMACAGLYNLCKERNISVAIPGKIDRSRPIPDKEEEQGWHVREQLIQELMRIYGSFIIGPDEHC